MPRLGVGGRYCVRFAYHMYGFHVDTLVLQRITAMGESRTAWVQSRDRGNIWFEAAVNVDMGINDQVGNQERFYLKRRFINIVN